MHTYLAWFTIYDSEHEHSGYFLVQADTLAEAFAIAKSQQHYTEDLTDEDHRTYFDFGDGLTASKLEYLQEITREEADMLNRLGVACYINQRNVRKGTTKWELSGV